MYVLRQGMEWLLKMYLEGECSDYRFTYDAYAPSASQLLSYIDSLQAPSSSSRAEDAEAVHLQDDSSQDSPVAPVPTEVQVSWLLTHISTVLYSWNVAEASALQPCAAVVDALCPLCPA